MKHTIALLAFLLPLVSQAAAVSLYGHWEMACTKMESRENWVKSTMDFFEETKTELTIETVYTDKDCTKIRTVEVMILDKIEISQSPLGETILNLDESFSQLSYGTFTKEAAAHYGEINLCGIKDWPLAVLKDLTGLEENNCVAPKRGTMFYTIVKVIGDRFQFGKFDEKHMGETIEGRPVEILEGYEWVKK